MRHGVLACFEALIDIGMDRSKATIYVEEDLFDDRDQPIDVVDEDIARKESIVS